MSESLRLTRKQTGIFAGIFLLLTFALPFAVPEPDAGAVWSWEILDGFARMPTEMKAMLVGGWSLGLLVLVFAACLRGLPLAMAYLVFGIAGAVVLFGIAKLPVSVYFIPAATDAPSAGFWPVAGLTIGGVFLVVTGIRSRLGATPVVCLAQIVAAALFTGLCGNFAVQHVRHVVEGIREHEQFAPALRSVVRWDVIEGLAAYGLLGLAGLFSFGHGLARKSTSTHVSTAAFRLAWFVVLCMMAYWLFSPIAKAFAMEVMREELADQFFFNAHFAIRTVCAIAILLEGTIAISCEVGYMVFRPAGDRPKTRPFPAGKSDV